ncbi:MAG TPA: hypothetical protein V6D03_16245 [Candidatus Caenarcaniphilales bacterium]
MGIFDQILGAIENPNQQASSGQLGSILNTVQQLSNNQGADALATQAMMSIVGSHVRAALQQKRAAAGDAQAQALVNRYSGTTANPQAVQSLFTPTQQQQAVQDTANRTGLNADTIQAMLPVLIPLVLNLLQSGTPTQNPQGANPVLNAFLDADRDGEVDMGDALRLASRFLNQPR